MNYLEIAGSLIGLIYLYLEYRASAWLWLVGVIMPAIYIVVYYQAGLYADMAISVYYILASIYGGICWLRDKDSAQSESESGITSLPHGMYLPLGLLLIVLSICLGYILTRFTDSTVPWADGFTTALSILAMWMLARKYAEQWLAWIIADAGCSILYAYKGLWFTSALYLVYAIIAWFGFKKWKTL